MTQRTTKIPRYSAFPARWKQLVASGQPFVVAGAGRSRLDLKLAEQVGEATEVMVKNQIDGAVGTASLSDLVRCLGEDGAVWYMAQQAVPEPLERYVPKRPVANAPGMRKPNLWLGSAGAFTQLHQDVLHNLILQLDGVKQFMVFAPQDDRYLYRETSAERPNYSQIPLTSRVDRRRFPNYRRARAFRVELRPRDIFVLPAYWWHEVLTLEDSLMLNYWWAPTPASVRGIDVEAQILSGAVARRHVMKHLDLSAFASDHALVEDLCRQKLHLLAAVMLEGMGEDFVAAVAAKRGIDPQLYPSTAEAVLKTKGQLPPDVAELLKLIRLEASTADQCLKNRAPAPRLETRRLNQRLRQRRAALGLPLAKRLVRNNRAWMKNVSADSYLY